MKNMDIYKPGYKALRTGRVSIPEQIYLVTSTTHQRQPLFSNPLIARTACACFEDRQLLKDSRMLAWVLMPDHAHWLIQLGDRLELSALVLQLKSASSRYINREHQMPVPLWEKGFHDRAIREEENLPAVARYIVANPLRAGLVPRVGDYPYWNAVWI